MSLFDGARASEQKEVRKRGVDYAPFDGASASEPGVCADAGRTPGIWPVCVTWRQSLFSLRPPTGGGAKTALCVDTSVV